MSLEISNNENYICLICYQIKNKKEKKPIQLKNQNIYIKTCECNGLFHNCCLEIWYNKSNKCPICREYMLNKNAITTVIIISENNTNENNTANIDRFRLIFKVYCFIQNNWFSIVNVCNIFIFICIVYNFYLSIFNYTQEDLI
jgi:hypothetical protein